MSRARPAAGHTPRRFALSRVLAAAGGGALFALGGFFEAAGEPWWVAAYPMSVWVALLPWVWTPELPDDPT